MGFRAREEDILLRGFIINLLPLLPAHLWELPWLSGIPRACLRPYSARESPGARYGDVCGLGRREPIKTL